MVDIVHNYEDQITKHVFESLCHRARSTSVSESDEKTAFAMSNPRAPEIFDGNLPIFPLGRLLQWFTIYSIYLHLEISAKQPRGR